MQPLLGLTTHELEEAAQTAGQPAYRGKQLAAWLYRRGAKSLDEMNDLPRELRTRLAETYFVGLPATAHRDQSQDETIKYLFAMPDGQQIESVYLPYPD